MNTVSLIILKSDGKDWVVVEPGDVPEWLKVPETVAHLMEGEGAQAPDSDEWYIGVCPEEIHDVH